MFVNTVFKLPGIIINAKFFQICSSVIGYGELCVCFQPIRKGEIF